MGRVVKMESGSLNEGSVVKLAMAEGGAEHERQRQAKEDSLFTIDRLPAKGRDEGMPFRVDPAVLGMSDRDHCFRTAWFEQYDGKMSHNHLVLHGGCMAYITCMTVSGHRGRCRRPQRTMTASKPTLQEAPEVRPNVAVEWPALPLSRDRALSRSAQSVVCVV